MTERTETTATRLRVAALKTSSPTRFDLRPDAEACAALADKLGLLGLRKLRLAGELAPEGREGWLLDATLGATVVQPCVVTLDPVTTRIDEEVTRRYLPAETLLSPDAGAETEMPEDGDEVEALPDSIDLRAIMTEALSLALPAYPRSPAAEEAGLPTDEDAAEEPEDEARPNPFADLAGLRDKLAEGGGDND